MRVVVKVAFTKTDRQKNCSYHHKLVLKERERRVFVNVASTKERRANK